MLNIHVSKTFRRKVVIAITTGNRNFFKFTKNCRTNWCITYGSIDIIIDRIKYRHEELKNFQYLANSNRKCVSFNRILTSIPFSSVNISQAFCSLFYNILFCSLNIQKCADYVKQVPKCVRRVIGFLRL